MEQKNRIISSIPGAASPKYLYSLYLLINNQVNSVILFADTAELSSLMFGRGFSLLFVCHFTKQSRSDIFYGGKENIIS